jgi:hypothetical protein
MTNHSPGNAGLSDEAAGVSNDGAKSENADIAASAENGKRRALSCPLQPAPLFNVLLTDHSPRRLALSALTALSDFAPSFGNSGSFVGQAGVPFSTKGAPNQNMRRQ